MERLPAVQRAEEYVERFRELLTQAVADRLRTDRLSTQLSGGLDSTSIAAIAQRLLTAAGTPFDLRAFTLVSERLIADEEGKYARMVAEATGIPTEYLPVDDYLEAESSERFPVIGLPNRALSWPQGRITNCSAGRRPTGACC